MQNPNDLQSLSYTKTMYRFPELVTELKSQISVHYFSNNQSLPLLTGTLLRRRFTIRRRWDFKTKTQPSDQTQIRLWRDRNVNLICSFILLNIFTDFLIFSSLTSAKTFGPVYFLVKVPSVKPKHIILSQLLNSNHFKHPAFIFIVLSHFLAMLQLQKNALDI